ncbi:MAG: PEGA domain-containing protein [Pyrinomonadaceae bacterium]
MRKNLIAFGVLAAILVNPNFMRGISQTQQQPTSPELLKSSPFLAEDTPIKLRLMQTLSSGTSKVNDKVDFEVVEDVKVGNIVVVPQGGTAIATVTEARTKKSFGRSGKLNVNIDYVRLGNGDKVALRAVKGGTGGSRTGVMTGAVVATAIVFFPAAPLFFFIKGKNITIPKGTEITAYVAANTALNTVAAASPSAAPSNASAQPPDSMTTNVATIIVRSDPNGAEITIDGKFMGTTESTLKLAPGEHTVSIGKSGFKEWNRTITLNAGSSITIDATLEKSP